jgi:hypothetical protein
VRAFEPAFSLQDREKLIVVHMSRRGDHAISAVVAVPVKISEIFG